MKSKFFGNDFSLTGQTLVHGFWLFIATGFVVGVLRAFFEPILPYVDVDWKVQAVTPAPVEPPHSVNDLSTWTGSVQPPQATPDPVADWFRSTTEPGAVLMPKLQLPLTPELAFSQFFMGRDLSSCVCSGEAEFRVQWANRAYTTKGMFLDLSQPLENLKILRPLDTLDRIYNGGFFEDGPAPRIAGYEQLAGNNFRFVVGELVDPISKLASLSYGRNTDWLSFPSKFAPAQANPNSPWSIYQDESIYPWLGADLIANCSAGSLTACALTHAIDFDEFPLQWQELLPTTAHQWVGEETAWKLSSAQVMETFTNYQAGLVVTALASRTGNARLLLFSAHDKRLLAINPFPLGKDGKSDRHFTRLQFSPNGWVFAGYDNYGELYFYHTKTLQLLRHYDQVDGRSSRIKTVRLAFNARGNRFIAPARKSGDLIEIDFVENRLLRLKAPDPVSAFAYATSYDDVDTLVTVSAVGGRIIKYRLDRGTAAREEKFLLAGLYPKSMYLNFSAAGTHLLGTASEASVDGLTPPRGKSIGTTQSRLLVWDLTRTEHLDPVPSTNGPWPLSSGSMVRGEFIKLARRSDGWHVLVRDPQHGIVDIPSRAISRQTLDQALVLSSVVRSPIAFNGGQSQ